MIQFTCNDRYGKNSKAWKPFSISTKLLTSNNAKQRPSNFSWYTFKAISFHTIFRLNAPRRQLKIYEDFVFVYFMESKWRDRNVKKSINVHRNVSKHRKSLAAFLTSISGASVERTNSLALHKRWSFRSRISSANVTVTKSAVS